MLIADRSQWVLPNLLRQRAAELGDTPLVSFAVDDASLTYAEADARSDRLAAGLARLGVGRGDRVAVMMGNRVEFVLTWFALNKLGAFHAPINTDYRGDFLEHLINTAQANVAVVEGRFVETVSACAPRTPLLNTLITVGEVPEAEGCPFDLHDFNDIPSQEEPPVTIVTPADIYAVLFTSGTTGRSKGALMPYAHGHLLNERNLELLDLTPGSKYITELPLFHINAHMTVYGCMIARAEARIEERFSASRWLDRVRRSKATHSSMLGVMVDFVMRQPPTEHDRDHSLRSVWMVPCSPALAGAFSERFGVDRVVTSYGTSEVGMLARRVMDGSSDDLSSGTIDPELYEVKIVDERDEPLPTGEIGEVVVRTKLPWTVSTGYFGMPDRTTEAFRNLWFHTGDAGKFDEQGRFYFMDRLADRIRRRGENVASADVEHVLAGHPAIREVAIVAVPADEAGGEDEIKACVVVQETVRLELDEFWAWCDERLPFFAAPRYLELLLELPKTPTEKVIKNELRKERPGARVHDRGPTGRRERAASARS